MRFCRADVVHSIEFAPIAESFLLCLEFHHRRHFGRLHFCFASSFPQSFENYLDPSIDRFLSSITCSHLEIPARAASSSLHHMLREHTVTAESDSPVYQFGDYVLALLTDRRDIFHLNDEF